MITEQESTIQTMSADVDGSLTNIAGNVEFRGGVKPLPGGHVPAYRAVFLIANAALGAGMLNFPQAYMQAGGVTIALIVQFTLLFFIVGAFLILSHCAEHSQGKNYQDVIKFMLGERIFMVSQVLISIYFLGSAITYIIIIGEQMSSVICYASGETKVYWYSSKVFLFTMFALLFLLPLVLPRKLKALSYTSFFGGIGAFFIAFVIVYRHFDGSYGTHTDEHGGDKPMAPTDWKSAFAALPVICFGFQCHVSSVAVYAELKARSMRKFFSCAMVAMAVCTVTYALAGTFGYKTFGAKTKADILSNYRDDDILVVVARVCIVFILLSSFSIVSFCARTVVDGVILSMLKKTAEQAEGTERRRRVLETLAWFLVVLLLAAVVPDIGVAISLIGGVASTFIFVFPGMCLLKTVDLKKPVLTRKDYVIIAVCSAYLIVGAFIFGEVTTLALMNDITGRQLQ